MSRVSLSPALGSLSLTALALQCLLPAQAIAEDVERIEITGSRIKQVHLETATPVLSLSREEIEAKGFNSLQEAMENLTENAGGALTQQEGLGFTPAASSVNLRGVGYSRVLVLMDGVRMTKYPFGFSGTDSFVDLANIPLSAIERVEILKSGASAIYGSDAMGGVINIITRKQMDGTQVNYRFSDTDAGGLTHHQLTFATGMDTSLGQLTVALEYDDREALHASDRPQWGTDAVAGNYYAGYSSYGASLVGLSASGKEAFVQQTLSQQECESRGLVWLERGANSQCGSDRASQQDFLPESQRVSALIKLEGDIGTEHQWFVRANLADSRTRTEQVSSLIDDEFMLTVAGDKVTLTDTRDWGLSHSFDKSTGFGGDFATAADGVYKYKRRLHDLGPRVFEYEGQSYELLAGLNGALTDEINYDLHWSYGRQDVRASFSGLPTMQGIFDYLTAGENGNSLLDEINSEDAAAINHTSINDGLASMQTIHAGINGDTPLQLWGGPVAFATGVEFSQERFSSQHDEVTLSGAIIGKGGASANGERDQYAAYVETQLPLLQSLTLTLAGRYDYYQDTHMGGEFSPQFALEFRPLDDLLLRAFWGETFRAPDLLRLHGEPTMAFADLTDAQGNKYEGVTIYKGANPELDAETGDNFNLGLVYSPGNVDFSLDYWRINIDDMIASPSAQYIFQHESVYGGRVVRDEFGNLVSVNSQAINMSSNEMSGLDIALGYRLETELGEFSALAQATYMIDWDLQQTPFSAPIDMLNDDGSVPKWQANLNLGWQYADLESNLLLTYISSMNGYNKEAFINAGMDDEYDVTPDSHTQVNWSLGYRVNQQVRLTAGINNLFDAGPELDATRPGWPYYSRPFYNPVGREYYAGLQLNF